MASIFKQGNTALITGAASGIGLALAQKCIKSGMTVGLLDNNVDNLAAALKSLGPAAKGWVLDVSQPPAWDALKPQILAALGGHVDFLALNAGRAVREVSWADPAYFQQTLSTNLAGVIKGITMFLPVIQGTASKERPAAIVVTGSKQGITNPPGNPAYNASKAAVKSLAESLSYDLHKSHPFISVHLLVPGWTYTGLSGAKPGSVEGKPEGAWTPTQVVEFLESKMREGTFYVLCPDNETTEGLDRRRILWGVGDLVEGREPLSRWREETKVEAEKWIRREE